MPLQTKKRPAQAKAGPSKKKKLSALGHGKLIAGCEVVSPEEAGVSAEPLQKLRSIVHEEVHEIGSLSGVAHLILHEGKCIFSLGDGWSDIASGRKFGVKTLCALHSCSKPLTVVAFLTLVEEGKVQLSDPISKYLPYPQQVVDGEGKVRKSKTPATLYHLLTQTGGLKHSDAEEYKGLVSLLRRRQITDLSAFCDALFQIPLQSTPGDLHYYSLSIDVLGRVCEIASGMPLDEFMTKSLFEPLGMLDTHFIVPASKHSRTAKLYDCKRVPTKQRNGGDTRSYHPRLWDGPKMDPHVFSGGGGVLSYADAGIYSTVEDYARFCQMLLNDGKLQDGSQFLRKATVDKLWQDCLAPFAKTDGTVSGWNDFGGSDPEEIFYWNHHAWSLLNATLDLAKMPKKKSPPRTGHTMWMYGMGAYWFIDRKRQLIAISFAQCFSSRSKDRGSDCVAFAKDAVDQGPAGMKIKVREPEIFYGKEPDPSWKNLVAKQA